tara:strand:+ start:27 stop:443 length:417 start_codon:yes stop_codon:yes gene_type:complete
MALIGNCSNTVYTSHETETTTESITEFNEGGEEVTLYEVPVKVATTTSYTNVYLVINQVDNLNRVCSDCGEDGEITYQKDFSYRFAAYESKTARNNDPDTHLFWYSSTLENYNHNISLYEQIYDTIKTKEGLTNLIKD